MAGIHEKHLAAARLGFVESGVQFLLQEGTLLFFLAVVAQFEEN